MVPSRYAYEWTRLKKTYEIWHQWHSQLNTTRMVVPDGQRLDMEQRAGIRPK